MSQPYNEKIINSIYLLTPLADVKEELYIIFHRKHLTQIITYSLITVLKCACA